MEQNSAKETKNTKKIASNSSDDLKIPKLKENLEDINTSLDDIEMPKLKNQVSKSNSRSKNTKTVSSSEKKDNLKNDVLKQKTISNTTKSERVNIVSSDDKPKTTASLDKIKAVSAVDRLKSKEVINVVDSDKGKIASTVDKPKTKEVSKTASLDKIKVVSAVDRPKSKEVINIVDSDKGKVASTVDKPKTKEVSKTASLDKIKVVSAVDRLKSKETIKSINEKSVKEISESSKASEEKYEKVENKFADGGEFSRVKKYAKNYTDEFPAVSDISEINDKSLEKDDFEDENLNLDDLLKALEKSNIESRKEDDELDDSLTDDINLEENEEKQKLKKKKKKSKKLKPSVVKTISGIFIIVCLVSVILFSKSVININIVPTRYLIIGYIVIGVILLPLFLLSFFNKNKIIKIISSIFIILFSSAFFFATSYIDKTYNFLEKIQVDEYYDMQFNVITLKENGYEKIEDLKDKKISYIEDNYVETLKNELASVIDYEENLLKKDNSLMTLSDLLEAKETNAIIYEDSQLEFIREIIEDFDDRLEIIYNFQIKVDSKYENEYNLSEYDDPIDDPVDDTDGNNSEKPIEEKPNEIEKPVEKPPVNSNSSDSPFIVYISGIDQRGSIGSSRGRSDVNQLVVVNPKSGKILLLNTPRDYFIPLHGANGKKDNLTHAGLYGINKSMATLEDFYGIKIDYYVRVNFDSVEKLVDAIGGIYVTVDEAFKSTLYPDIFFPAGRNYLNGQKALAYARERKKFSTGDNRRGENQQQIITAIINKVTQSQTLISNYLNILKSLEGTFQTNMSIDKITSLVKYQIDKMPRWQIETFAVTGTSGYDYAYSTGENRLVYVMIPNEQSVNNAKAKIKNIIG